MKDFSIIAAPLTEAVKKPIGFKWGAKQKQAFNWIKKRLCSSPTISLPNFSKTFETDCDASKIGIGAFLM